MTTNKLLIAASIAIVCTPAFAHGDAAAGKTKFEEACESCHFADDFAHEAQSVVEAMIKAIRSGETRHRPPMPDLTDEEIANLAAFLASQ